MPRRHSVTKSCPKLRDCIAEPLLSGCIAQNEKKHRVLLLARCQLKLMTEVFPGEILSEHRSRTADEWWPDAGDS